MALSLKNLRSIEDRVDNPIVKLYIYEYEKR